MRVIGVRLAIGVNVRVSFRVMIRERGWVKVLTLSVTLGSAPWYSNSSTNLTFFAFVATISGVSPYCVALGLGSGSGPGLGSGLASSWG